MHLLGLLGPKTPLQWAILSLRVRACMLSSFNAAGFLSLKRLHWRICLQYILAMRTCLVHVEHCAVSLRHLFCATLLQEGLGPCVDVPHHVTGRVYLPPSTPQCVASSDVNNRVLRQPLTARELSNMHFQFLPKEGGLNHSSRICTGKTLDLHTTRSTPPRHLMQGKDTASPNEPYPQGSE